MPGSVTLLIDGHNLAHHLFDLKTGQRLSAALAGRLVEHLERYRRGFAPPAPEIEIVFDGGVRPETPDPPGVRVMSAGPQNKADQVILERRRYHGHSQHACLVISNDQEVLEQIQEEGGGTLRIYDFVLLKSLRNPQFIAPADLLAVLPKTRRRTPAPVVAEAPVSVRLQPAAAHRARRKPPAAVPAAVPQPNPGRSNPAVVLPPLPEPALKEAARLAPAETFRCRLTIDRWPVAEGLRFLKNSVCKQHRGLFMAYLEGFAVEELRPADLQDLAKIVVASCGAEAGFSRSGSLMDRVRLALLNADLSGLSLAQISTATGLPLEGLHHRIKRKADGWLVIEP